MPQIIPGETTMPKTGRETTYSTPRWVKVFGIIALVVALLVVVMLVTGVGGEHGPGRHNPSGGAAETPSATLVATPLIEHGVQTPSP
jgi:hypothetical protein